MRVDIVDLFRNASVAILDLAHASPRPWDGPNALKAQAIPDPHARRVVGVHEVEDAPPEAESPCIPLECAAQQRPQPQAAPRTRDDKPGVAELDVPMVGLVYYLYRPRRVARPMTHMRRMPRIIRLNLSTTVTSIPLERRKSDARSRTRPSHRATLCHLSRPEAHPRRAPLLVPEPCRPFHRPRVPPRSQR